MKSIDRRGRQEMKRNSSYINRLRLASRIESKIVIKPLGYFNDEGVWCMDGGSLKCQIWANGNGKILDYF